jgi:hypothetical protein
LLRFVHHAHAATTNLANQPKIADQHIRRQRGVISACVLNHAVPVSIDCLTLAAKALRGGRMEWARFDYFSELRKLTHVIIA